MHSHTLIVGLTVDGKQATGGGTKKRLQRCSDDSGTIVHFRALQGRYWSIITDNVVIPSNFFQHIYHVGCAINLHSIINSGLVLGGQNSSKRQTVFFLLVDLILRAKVTRILMKLTWMYHIVHNTLHNAWKRHQSTKNWVDINLAIEKWLTFYQTRSNAIILQETLPA